MSFDPRFDPRYSHMRTDPRPPYSPPDNCIPVGSYAQISDNEMGTNKLGDTKQIVYSRPIAADPLNPTPADFFNDNTFETQLDSNFLSLKGERPWVVSINAMEHLTVVREGSVNAPISVQRIASLERTRRYSTLQALIKVADGSPFSKIIKVDIAGGTTIPVIGKNVQVSILSPANTQIVTREDQVLNPAFTGLVYNTVISAKIAPMLNSNGNYDILKYTVNRAVAANDTEFIEIPPSARRVRIINATTAVTTASMYFWMSDDAASGHSMGIIDFLAPNTPNATLEINIPVGATHIYTGTVDQANDRAFSFVFLIDP